MENCKQHTWEAVTVGNVPYWKCKNCRASHRRIIVLAEPRKKIGQTEDAGSKGSKRPAKKKK